VGVDVVVVVSPVDGPGPVPRSPSRRMLSAANGLLVASSSSEINLTLPKSPAPVTVTDSFGPRSTLRPVLVVTSTWPSMTVIVQVSMTGHSTRYVVPRTAATAFEVWTS
jgi:hypothetical protein